MRRWLFVLCLLCNILGLYAKQATLEGVLRMCVVDNEGNVRTVSKYQETDCHRLCLVFVVELSKKLNVVPYLEDGEDDFISSPYQSGIMVVPQFSYSAKNFAAQYANKRVRVSGNLYAPGGGWRNATDVVMELKNIKQL